MIRTDINGDVASIWLEDAERGNALSGALVEALTADFDAVARRGNVGTVIFRSSARHFCTGFDLADLDAQSDGDLLLRFVRIEALLSAISDAPFRTVAVAEGSAYGAGADLFTACDIRIATSRAKFRFPGSGFGLVLGTGRLAERVGSSTAHAWMAQGRLVSASEAQKHGMVTDLVPDSAFDMQGAVADVCGRYTCDPAAWMSLRQASRTRGPDAADRDLAALVRSASRAGLGARIAAFRDAATAVNRRSTLDSSASN